MVFYARLFSANTFCGEKADVPVTSPFQFGQQPNDRCRIQIAEVLFFNFAVRDVNLGAEGLSPVCPNNRGRPIACYLATSAKTMS